MRTRVSQFASGIWNWIATIAWRALTHWRLIFSDANGILATRQFVADIVASVCETIAQLCWRTIDVVDARHTLATRSHVVWIAIVWTWWALTFGDVIVTDANRLRSTIHVFTCWSAGTRSRWVDSFAFL